MTHNVEELELLIRAAAFAAHTHREQRRKDAAATPSINHPLGLAHILSAEGAVTDIATLCAALLHDTIEDTKNRRTSASASSAPRSGRPSRKSRTTSRCRRSKRVVDRMRGARPALERVFDDAYALPAFSDEH